MMRKDVTPPILLSRLAHAKPTNKTSLLLICGNKLKNDHSVEGPSFVFCSVLRSNRSRKYIKPFSNNCLGRKEEIQSHQPLDGTRKNAEQLKSYYCKDAAVPLPK